MPNFLLLIFFTLVPFFIVAQKSLDNFELINSPYDEQNPVLSKDGTKLYFTIAYHPDNKGGIIDPGDIWVSSKLENGKWSSPTNLSELNTHEWNGVVGFVNDGKRVYLMGHYNSNLIHSKIEGVSFSELKNNSWTKPQNIKIPYFKNLSSHHSAFITHDEQFLFFSIESYSSRGGEDIFLSKKIDLNNWSEPKNIGSVINTKYQEFSPFWSEDSQKLFFASNGYTEGTNIYESSRTDNSWNNWTTPIKVEGIDFGGKEMYARVYSDRIIYTSTHNSDGYSDIYEYKFIESQNDNNLDTVELVNNIFVLEQNIDNNSILKSHNIVGTFYDEKTDNLINGTVFFFDATKQLLDEVIVKNGEFQLNFDSIGKYTIIAESKGYLTNQKEIEISSDMINKFIEIDFILSPIEIGKSVNLKNIIFRQSESELLPQSYPALDVVVRFLKQNPEVKIRLEGHTDNRGISKHNVKLSKNRVDSVKSYLVQKGINKKRIQGIGYGGSRPIADNNDERERGLNRRVEFRVIQN